MPEQEPPKLLVLPSFIQSRLQVHQTLSEILQIEKFLSEAQTREPGSKISLPKTTADLDKFAEANKRNVLNHSHRMELASFLRDVYKLAPVVGVMLQPHADKSIGEGIVEWFRSNVHAQTLIQVSVQNKLYGGAVIRIKHKTYDASLASRFKKADTVLQGALNNHTSQPVATAERTKYF